MWLKKKSVLQGEGHYNSNTSYDGTDWRTNQNSNGWSALQTLPSASDAGKYFYLPALGYYGGGQLRSVTRYGFYWSSSIYPGYSDRAYILHFLKNGITVSDYPCNDGQIVGGFE